MDRQGMRSKENRGNGLCVSKSSVTKILNYVMGIRDPNTKGHDSRLANHSIRLLKRLIRRGIIKKNGWSHNVLRNASLLHDIGKIGVSDGILKKKGVLTKEEWIQMKKHPLYGYKIVGMLKQFRKEAECIKHHHEHFDGKGYPDHLKGKKIPPLSRILSIVDAYDAMTSNRCYRKKLSKRTAFKELVENSGTQFDPEYVKEFLQLIKK